MDSKGTTKVSLGVLEDFAHDTRINKKITNTFSISLIAFLLCCIFSPALLGAISPISHKDLKGKIDQILSSGDLKPTEVGIKVVSLKTGETLYEKNPNTLLIPASNAKLFTAIAALKQMGPKYRFPTKVLTDGSISEGTLKGNLFIQGTGDTFFVTELIYYLANELARQQFSKVTGDLVIDDFYFDRDYEVPPGDRAYVAPTGAVSANFNSIAAYVRPGKKAGEPAIVILDPPNDYISLKNETKTVKAGSTQQIDVQRVRSGDHRDVLIVKGTVPISSKEDVYYRSISDPPLYAGSVIKSILAQRGIAVQGTVRHGKTPGSAQELLVYESKTFDLLVRDLLNFSNNMIANQLLKTMGAARFGAPGSLEKGLRAEREILDSLGIKPKSYNLVDGSGYDRGNRVSADQFTTLLTEISKDPVLSPGFKFALPVAGEEGTLKRRFKDSASTGRLRAKTGSLTGVASLAGYAPTADGEWLAFSILMNDKNGRMRELYKYQDQIGDLLCRFTRRP